MDSCLIAVYKNCRAGNLSIWIFIICFFQVYQFYAWVLAKHVQSHIVCVKSSTLCRIPFRFFHLFTQFLSIFSVLWSNFISFPLFSNVFPITSTGGVFQTPAKVHITASVNEANWHPPIAVSISASAVTLCVLAPKPDMNRSFLFFHRYVFPSANQSCSSISTTISRLFWNVDEKNYKMTRAGHIDLFCHAFKTRFRHLSVFTHAQLVHVFKNDMTFKKLWKYQSCNPRKK